MFDKLKNTIKAEAQKEAQKLKQALEDTKNGVKGAKEKAKDLADKLAKNTAVAPLLPLIPAMLYLLKKEKGLTYSAKQVASERYIIVQDFYKQIVEPHFNPKPSNVSVKKGKLKANLENFDFNEMMRSDFDEQPTADITGTDTTVDTESALSGLFNSAMEGGSTGAKYGASVGTLLAGVGVPPPVSNLAGATAGAQLGAIVGACIKFFKLGLSKVKEALSKTGTKVDDISSGVNVGSDDISTQGAFDFKKLLIPVVALAIIYFVVIKKK
jgi:hypothetical protein